MGYRGLGWLWIWRRKWDAYLFIHLGPPKPSKKLKHAVRASSYDRRNTYPWPYRDPQFANWEEDDSPEGYNLISDPAGFVVRRSTSYCAWKIYEATGYWPTNHGANRHRYDARDWEEFLEMNYCHRVTSEEFTPYSGYCYIGIISDQGEFGQVVHLENVHVDFLARTRKVNYYVSTYEDFRYKAYWLTDEEIQNIIWMGTSRYHVPLRGWRKLRYTIQKARRQLRLKFR